MQCEALHCFFEFIPYFNIFIEMCTIAVTDYTLFFHKLFTHD